MMRYRLPRVNLLINSFIHQITVHHASFARHIKLILTDRTAMFGVLASCIYNHFSHLRFACLVEVSRYLLVLWYGCVWQGILLVRLNLIQLHSLLHQIILNPDSLRQRIV